ncbi:MAG: DUF3243 domain-containing protein [Clostridia bacterium]|nr:DUF3243 domain-containing protein [Clostridia bacterium]MCL6521641.1 DUF3243 domain-containing protein [Bacillota bacterium]
MEYTDTFDRFKQELAQRVSAAQEMGMNQAAITEQASRIGDWLVREVAPRSPEQRLLKEMWQVSNEAEQRALASSLTKLVSRS